MNKKLIRNIVIAAVVIAVLGVAYFFAMNWEPEKQADENDNQQTAQEIVVISLSLNEIKSVDFDNAKGKFRIEKDGVDYTVPGYENANLASVRLTSPFIKLERIVAEREIEGEINPDEYGFSNPSATVTVTKTDNETVKLIIGNTDPTAFGYYMKLDGNDTVYLVEESRILDFFLGVDDFKNKHIADFSIETLESFELYKGKELVTSIRKRNETDTLTDIVIEQHIMTYPFYEYISLEEFAVPFENLESINAIEEVAPSASEGSSYGIGEYTIKYTDGNGSYVIKLGSKAPDGSVYAVCEGVNAVYTIPGEWLVAVKNFVPFDYLYKLTNVYMIDDVSEVSFVCPDGEYKLECNDGRYMINGKTVDETTYKDVYTIFVSMAFTGDGRNVKPGRQIGSVAFGFKDGSSAVSKYFEADDRNYLVVKPDGSKYLVLKKNFDPVYESISALIR